ncbi:MAG: hypothetical protein KatS3mg011_0385 [Acidimicrobiia bacterium]|nr:MAG: hypothetical protein KatS3mg011_0385 [Acidimicrobiia bacterium]
MNVLPILLGVVGLLFPFLVVGVIVAAMRRPGAGVDAGTVIRWFVVYGFTFGLMVVVAQGISDLLGLFLPGGRVLGRAGAADVAGAVSFTLVGTPALWGMWRHVSSRVRTDPAERSSLGWGAFLTVAEWVFLLVGFAALGRGIIGLLGADGSAAPHLVDGLVWGAGWGWLHFSVRPQLPPHPQVNALAGSGGALVGLVAWTVAGISLVSLIADLAYAALVGSPMVGDGFASRRLVVDLVWLLLGGAVWIWYWLVRRPEAGPIRSIYTVAVAVLGGAVTTLTAVAVTLYTVLTWVFGTAGTGAATHFRTLADTVPVALIGAIVWRLHWQEPLGPEGVRARRYLLAGIALVAAATGLGVVVSALLSTLEPPLAGRGSVEVFLAGVTALVVAGPVWLNQWAPVATVGPDDTAARSRRIYLTLLAGVGGLVGLVTLIVLVFRLTEALVEGTSNLIGQLRGPVGVLTATLAVASYHLVLWRRERPAEAARPRRISLVLVAAEPGAIAGELESRFDVDLVAYRLDDAEPVDPARVVEAVERDGGDDLLVVARPEEVQVFHLRR